jgi:hypothetical protein
MVKVRSNIRKTSRKTSRKPIRKPIRKTSCKTSKKTIHRTAKKIGGACIRNKSIKIRDITNVQKYYIIEDPIMLINYIRYFVEKYLPLFIKDPFFQKMVINLKKIFINTPNPIYDHLTICNDEELSVEHDLFKMIIYLDNIKKSFIYKNGTEELGYNSNENPLQINKYLLKASNMM